MLPTKQAKKEHRNIRRVKAYATYDGAQPPAPRKLDKMAPAASAAHPRVDSTTAVPSADVDVASSPVLTGTIKNVLKAAKYTTLSKRAIAVASAIAAGAKAASPSSDLRLVTKRILCATATDRDTGISIGVTHVALDVASPQTSRHFLVLTKSDTDSKRLEKLFRKLADAEGGSPADSKAPFVSVVLGDVSVTTAVVLQMPTAKDSRRGCVCVVATPEALQRLSSTSPIWKMKFAAIIVDNIEVPAAVASQLWDVSAARTALRMIVGEPGIIAAETDASPTATVADKDAQATTAAAASSKTRVDYVVAEGLHRLQLLYSIVANNGATKRIVVAFATPQTCSFMQNLLFALKVECEILSDDEAAGPDGALAILREFEEKKVGQGCVLLTCTGLIPKNGDVFVQYDPIAIPLNAYATRIATLPSASAAKDGTSTSSGAKRKRDDGSDTMAASTSYNFIVLFLYPSEQRSIVPILTAGGKGSLELHRLEVTNTVRYLVTLKKVGALLKKVFVLNSKAYEAYRSLMLVYSHLKPKSVFDVYALDFTHAAQQFGLDDAPLLDLRTKDTQFRPKEDFVKMAAQRYRKEQREMIARAAETIKPEGSEVEEQQ